MGNALHPVHSSLKRLQIPELTSVPLLRVLWVARQGLNL
jgi:hypothetical protein